MSEAKRHGMLTITFCLYPYLPAPCRIWAQSMRPAGLAARLAVLHRRGGRLDGWPSLQLHHQREPPRRPSRMSSPHPPTPPTPLSIAPSPCPHLKGPTLPRTLYLPSRTSSYRPAKRHQARLIRSHSSIPFRLRWTRFWHCGHKWRSGRKRWRRMSGGQSESMEGG